MMKYDITGPTAPAYPVMFMLYGHIACVQTSPSLMIKDKSGEGGGTSEHRLVI